MTRFAVRSTFHSVHSLYLYLGYVLRQNCTTRTELRQGLCETKYIVWKATVQTGCSSVRFRCKASIFIRKTLRVRPRNRVGGLSPTQVHRVGPAFFDEDDVCAVSQTLNSLSELLPVFYLTTGTELASNCCSAAMRSAV